MYTYNIYTYICKELRICIIYIPYTVYYIYSVRYIYIYVYLTLPSPVKSKLIQATLRLCCIVSFARNCFSVFYMKAVRKCLFTELNMNNLVSVAVFPVVFMMLCMYTHIYMHTLTGSQTSLFTLSRVLKRKLSKPLLDTTVTNPRTATADSDTNLQQMDVSRPRSGSKTSQGSNHSLVTGL